MMFRNDYFVLVFAHICYVIAVMIGAPPVHVAAQAAQSTKAKTSAVFPSLKRTIVLAKQRAPDTLMAALDVRVARAEYRGARLPILANPYLEVFLDRGNQNATKDVTVQSNLWLPFEVSGQRGRRIGEVDALVEMRGNQLRLAEAIAASQATEFFGRAVIASERVKTLQWIVGVFGEQAEIYRKRLALGDATRQDTSLAEVELAQNQLAQAEAEADLVHALTELARLTGFDSIRAPGSTIEAQPPARSTAPSPHIERWTARSPWLAVNQAQALYYLRVAGRHSREAHTPLNFILTAGRGDLGETRLGGGLAWTFPVLRRNQGEVARALAQRGQAVQMQQRQRQALRSSAVGLTRELRQTSLALETLVRRVQPAAEIAVEAAVETLHAGKGDVLKVLTARGYLARVKLQRLELMLRQWLLLAQWVELFGEVP